MSQNESWRPSSSIRTKVIGIAKHHDRLLVCEVLDDDGALKGWCPLGGGVEFGETTEDALKREMQEELGCEVLISGTPSVYENIYEHHGVKGHEIVFAFPVSFRNPQIYARDRFQICEDRGSMHWVEWINIDRFRNGTTVLFPDALAPLIFSN